MRLEWKYMYAKVLLGNKILVSKGILYAKDIYDQHQFEVINANTIVDNLNVFKPVHDDIDHNPSACGFQKGWAKAKRHGHKYGRKYVDPFRQDIVDMFNLGEQNDAMKRTPGKMLVELRRKYPGRLDLPSETEVRSVISTLMSKKKRGKATITTSTRGIPEHYKETVLDIFRGDPSIVPRQAWEIFLQRHPPNEDELVLTYEAKVKSKISSLKLSFRRTGQLP